MNNVVMVVTFARFVSRSAFHAALAVLSELTNDSSVETIIGNNFDNRTIQVEGTEGEVQSYLDAMRTSGFEVDDTQFVGELDDAQIAA